MKNMIYKNFNKTDKQLLAQQVASAYFYGLVDTLPPQNVVDARAAHAANISSLERTVLLYTSVPNSHIMVGHLNDRLEQERLWLKHFDKCLQEHQRARNDLTKKVATEDKSKKKKGFWSTLFASETDATLLDPKEKRRRDLAKQRSTELANECETLAEVDLAAAAAVEAQAKAKKEADEAKKKAEAEKNKNKNNNNQQQQRNDNNGSRDSRRRFQMEDDGKKGNEHEQKRNLETEKA